MAAVLVSATYCALSAAMVAVAVALDRRLPIWEVTRGNLGVQTMGEVGLGLVGAMLAAMLNSAPNWAPMLLVPAGLLYFAKQSMDRADRRSRNMAVTSAVGRAVVGTLDPERAFQAIAESVVLDGLKLDGLALVPLDSPPAFNEHVASEGDRPSLRAALTAQLIHEPSQIDLRTYIRHLQAMNHAPRPPYPDLRFGEAGGIDLQTVGKIAELDGNPHFDFGDGIARHLGPQPDGE